MAKSGSWLNSGGGSCPCFEEPLLNFKGVDLILSNLDTRFPNHALTFGIQPCGEFVLADCPDDFFDGHVAIFIKD